jgi:hypothetical protein
MLALFCAKSNGVEGADWKSTAGESGGALGIGVCNGGTRSIESTSSGSGADPNGSRRQGDYSNIRIVPLAWPDRRRYLTSVTGTVVREPSVSKRRR